MNPSTPSSTKRVALGVVDANHSPKRRSSSPSKRRTSGGGMVQRNIATTPRMDRTSIQPISLPRKFPDTSVSPTRLDRIFRSRAKKVKKVLTATEPHTSLAMSLPPNVQTTSTPPSQRQIDLPNQREEANGHERRSLENGRGRVERSADECDNARENTTTDRPAVEITPKPEIPPALPPPLLSPSVLSLCSNSDEDTDDEISETGSPSVPTPASEMFFKSPKIEKLAPVESETTTCIDTGRPKIEDTPAHDQMRVDSRKEISTVPLAPMVERSEEKELGQDTTVRSETESPRQSPQPQAVCDDDPDSATDSLGAFSPIRNIYTIFQLHTSPLQYSTVPSNIELLKSKRQKGTDTVAVETESCANPEEHKPVLPAEAIGLDKSGTADEALKSTASATIFTPPRKERCERRKSRRQSYLYATVNAQRAERDLEEQRRQESQDRNDVSLVTSMHPPALDEGLLYLEAPGSIERKRNAERENSQRQSNANFPGSEEVTEAVAASKALDIVVSRLLLDTDSRSRLVAAVKIQSWWRGRREQQSYIRLLLAASCVQEAWHVILVRREHIHLRRLCLFMQQRWRFLLWRRTLNHLAQPAQVLGDVFGGFLARFDAKRAEKAANTSLTSPEKDTSIVSNPSSVEEDPVARHFEAKVSVKRSKDATLEKSDSKRVRSIPQTDMRSRLAMRPGSNLSHSHDASKFSPRKQLALGSPTRRLATKTILRGAKPLTLGRAPGRKRKDESEQQSDSRPRTPGNRIKSSLVSAVRTPPSSYASILTPSLNQFTPAEIMKSTRRNTLQNRLYYCDFERLVLHKDEPRPPSPTAKAQHRAAEAARLRRLRKAGAAGFAPGAGDDDGFELQQPTPTRKAVRWPAEGLEAGLEDEIPRRSPQHAKNARLARSCLVASCASAVLDEYGNLREPVSPSTMRGERVTVQKILYRGEVDEE